MKRVIAVVAIGALVLLAGCSGASSTTTPNELNAEETESTRLEIVTKVQVDNSNFRVVRDTENNNICYVLQDSSGDAMSCLSSSVVESGNETISVQTSQRLDDDLMLVIHDSKRDVTCYLKDDGDADSLNCIPDEK